MKYILPLEDGRWELREDDSPPAAAVEVSIEDFSGLADGTLTYLNSTISVTTLEET